MLRLYVNGAMLKYGVVDKKNSVRGLVMQLNYNVVFRHQHAYMERHSHTCLF